MFPFSRLILAEFCLANRYKSTFINASELLSNLTRAEESNFSLKRLFFCCCCFSPFVFFFGVIFRWFEIFFLLLGGKGAKDEINFLPLYTFSARYEVVLSNNICVLRKQRLFSSRIRPGQSQVLFIVGSWWMLWQTSYVTLTHINRRFLN